jgi:hypothetical protein
MPATHRTPAALLVTAGLALAACAGDGPRRNQPRPPAPIVVSGSIGKDRVSVSPARFGAGPISLIVVNQTDASQQITLESNDPIGTRPGLRQETAPINPRDTGTLMADVEPGRYLVHVGGDAIRPARIRVGARRASTQNQLLQP